MKKKRCMEYYMLVGSLMIMMDKWSKFHMQLVLSVDTWKNQVKSMKMGASNTEAQVSPTVFAVIWYVVMIHYIWTSASVY
jgi:hypothetical protein